MARFLTVRAAGHIEFTFDQCLKEFAEQKAHGRVSDFLSAHLFRGRSVTPRQLLEKLGWFDRELADDLRGLLKEDDEYLWRELKFLVDKRNKIAHGQPDGVGVVKAIALADVAIVIGDWLTTGLDPTA